MIYFKCHWGYNVNHLESYSGEMNFVGFLLNDFYSLSRGKGKAVSYTGSTHTSFEVLPNKFSLINMWFFKRLVSR